MTSMTTTARPASRVAAALVGLSLALAAFAAHATLRVGGELPTFRVADLNGLTHDSRELRGRPTLILAMTDSDAAEAMRRWGAAADRRVGPEVRRVQILSVALAFFVPTATIRSIARGQSHEGLWRSTWMERDGDLAESLGLPESETPYAIVVDARGQVRVVAHCDPASPQAEAVWEALSR